MDIVFWLGIATPAIIVLAVFTTLLLIQEKAAQPGVPTRAEAPSEPSPPAEEEHLHDQ